MCWGSSAYGPIFNGFNYVCRDLKGMGDVIGHLPQAQHDAVTKCMEEVRGILYLLSCCIY